MIRVETASPATMRWRSSSEHPSLTTAVIAARAARVEGSVIARVVIDTETAHRFAESGAIYETITGAWVDARSREELAVQP